MSDDELRAGLHDILQHRRLAAQLVTQRHSG
jgi:hypothetical protein